MNAFKTYTKFEDMIADLCSISDPIKEVLTKDDGTLPASSDDAACTLMDKIAEDLPSIFNENYPTVPAFSISGYEVGYKFPGQLSFGWRTESSEVDGEPVGDIIYKARVTVHANPIIAEKTSTMQDCAKLGYVLKEKTTPKKYSYNSK